MDASSEATRFRWRASSSCEIAPAFNCTSSSFRNSRALASCCCAVSRRSVSESIWKYAAAVSATTVMRAVSRA
jgi:hypothetical protein